MTIYSLDSFLSNFELVRCSMSDSSPNGSLIWCRKLLCSASFIPILPGSQWLFVDSQHTHTHTYTHTLTHSQAPCGICFCFPYASHSIWKISLSSLGVKIILTHPFSLSSNEFSPMDSILLFLIEQLSLSGLNPHQSWFCPYNKGFSLLF